MSWRRKPHRIFEFSYPKEDVVQALQRTRQSLNAVKPTMKKQDEVVSPLAATTGTAEQKKTVFDEYSFYRIQKTLTREVTLQGIGLHSGLTAKLTLCPAETGSGIVFEKRAAGGQAYLVAAHFSNVVSTHFATSLALPQAPDSRISTVEHILSAFYGLGISNARIRIEGEEIPILDGSSRPFAEALLDAGIAPQVATCPRIRILKPIKIYRDGVICELLPREGLRLTTSVEFNHPLIGLQTFALELTPRAFVDGVAASRTFGFLRDVDTLRSKNLALGASIENVLAFDENGILNKEGMRFSDECVRHKLLDAIGDLALAGARIDGELVSYRGGHSIHIELLKTLDKTRHSWEWVPAESIRLETSLETSHPPLEHYRAKLRL